MSPLEGHPAVVVVHDELVAGVTVDVEVDEEGVGVGGGGADEGGGHEEEEERQGGDGRHHCWESLPVPFPSPSRHLPLFLQSARTKKEGTRKTV